VIIAPPLARFQGVRAAAELRPDVDQIIMAIPELLVRLTHAQIAQRIIKSGLVIGQRSPLTVNTGDLANDLRIDINATAKEEIDRRSRESGSYHPDRYRDICRVVYTEAYIAAGVPRETRLEDVSELGMLKRIKSALLRLRSERQTRAD
jgi:hypothetical protein